MSKLIDRIETELNKNVSVRHEPFVMMFMDFVRQHEDEIEQIGIDAFIRVMDHLKDGNKKKARETFIEKVAGPDALIEGTLNSVNEIKSADGLTENLESFLEDFGRVVLYAGYYLIESGVLSAITEKR